MIKGRSDTRGWLKTRSLANATTTYDYTAWGGLEKVGYPDSTGIAYAYDPAHRLTDIIDSAGQRQLSVR